MGQGGLPFLDTSLVGEHNSLPKHHPRRTRLRTRYQGESFMRGSSGTLKEYTVEESLKIREGDGAPIRAVALIDWFGPFPAAEKGTPE